MKADPLNPVYLDFNRTTPLAPSVLEAMTPFWSRHFWLPGQSHPAARAVADALQTSRESVAEMLNCDSGEVVFTSGATESNNLAILGRAAAISADQRGTDCAGNHLVVSPLEPDSVFHSAVHLRDQHHWDVTVLDVDDDGVVKPDTVASAITEQTRLVCVSAASGIFGTRQLIREIADRCHQHGVPLHCDASHIPGHILMDLRGTRADTISISGHRMYGPKGTGALMVRSGYSLTPIVYGSCSEMTLRAGSENVTGWVGLGTAATLCSRIEEDVTARLASMRDMFVQVLREELGAAAKVHCESSDRLPNTVCISLPTDAAAALQKHPEIVVGRGHDSDTCCVFHRSLQAIGCDTKEESRSMCISLGWTTSEEQVCYAAERLAMSCV